MEEPHFQKKTNSKPGILRCGVVGWGGRGGGGSVLPCFSSWFRVRGGRKEERESSRFSQRDWMTLALVGTGPCGPEVALLLIREGRLGTRQKH